MLKNKLFIFFLFALVFWGIFGQTIAVIALELPWELEGISEEERLGEFIRRFFNLSLIIAGLTVFGVLVYAGFLYLISTGNPTKMTDAKNQIASAFLGLTILLSSYLLLHTIDPHLVILERPELEPPPPIDRPDLLPDPRISGFQEIPFGILIARVLDKDNLSEITDVFSSVKTKSEDLKKLTGKLQTLLGECGCDKLNPADKDSNRVTDCDYDQPCPAYKCPGDSCPNRKEINKKIEKINSKIKELEGWTDKYNKEHPGLLDEAEEMRNDFETRLTDLQRGEFYLVGDKRCQKESVKEHEAMVFLEGVTKEEINFINFLPGIIPDFNVKPLINRGIFNFYCEI